MAGSPLKRAMLAQLTRLAAEIGPDALPEDAVLVRVASGETLKSIAATLSQWAGVRIPSSVIGDYMNAAPERKAKLAKARRDSAPALVEDAIAILDDADLDRDAIARAKAQADIRTWLASRYDRATFGNDNTAQVSVNVSLGGLHLDALRRRTVPLLRPDTPAALPAGPDYEVVPTGLQGAEDA